MDIGKIEASIGSITTVIGIWNVVVDSQFAMIAHMLVGLGHVVIATLGIENQALFSGLFN